MHTRAYFAFALLNVVAACSGGSSGGAQQVSIRTVPDGAACTVRRGGTVLGTVDPTPGSLAVDSSDKDLAVTCRKPGWGTGSGTVRTVYQGIGLGRLLSGGPAAVVEDAAKSTDFRYDPGAVITLPPG